MLGMRTFFDIGMLSERSFESDENIYRKKNAFNFIVSYNEISMSIDLEQHESKSKTQIHKRWYPGI